MAADDPNGDDHPIINKAVGLLEVAEGKYVLSERNALELGTEVDLFLSTWELPIVVDALLRLAHVLESEWKSPQAADALCEVIERDPVLDALKARAQEAREQVEAAAADADSEEFRQFAGTGGKKAPKLGDAAPEGAVKLDAFKAPRRV